MKVLYKSTITCPKCGHKKEEKMPLSACQFFYDCEKCKEVLRPEKGDFAPASMWSPDDLQRPRSF